MTRTRVPVLSLLVSCSVSMAQPCHPYFADMGATPFTFYESTFVVFDFGAGTQLCRGDYLDRTLISWTPTGWQQVSLAGTASGFEPVWPMVLSDSAGTRLHVIGQQPGGGWQIYVRNGTAWTLSEMCYRNCPPFEEVWPVRSVDLGSGNRVYGIGFRPGQTSMMEVVRSDPNGWTTLGTSNRFVKTLAEFDDGSGPAVYAIGDFTLINSVPAAGLAKWDGQTWHNVLAAGVRVFGRDSHHVVVADLGDGQAIYMNGNVFFNGQDHVGINKWDGQEWTFIGAPDQLPPPSTPRYVNAITAFDDGRGMALYIGGLFASFSGVQARNIVRWNGSNFEPLGAGTVSEVEELTPFIDQRGPALHMCGDVMTGAGGGTLQQRGVLWIGCPNCYANCDLSTRQPTLNVADFICFLNKYAAKDPYANCTVDAAIDVNDFACFLSKFAVGCP